MAEKRGTDLVIPEIKKHRPLKIAIIIVVLLLVIAAPTGWFFYQQNRFNNTFTVVSEQIDVCVENALKNAVLQVGVLGGHAVRGDVLFEAADYSANYLSYRGQVMVPTRQELANNLGRYIGNDVAQCVSRISADVTVSADSYAATVAFDDGVAATLENPVTVQSRFFGRDYEGAAARVDISPAEILNPVQRIVSRITVDKGVTDFDAIDSEGYAVSLEVHEDENVITVLVQDLNQNIEGIAYAWLFAIDVS